MIAAVLPVVLEIPGSVGFMLVGVVAAAAVVNYVAGVRADDSQPGAISHH